MSPLTRDELREELNDRFEHYEKRQDERHAEMMQGFGQVIENVNGHMDERFDKIDARLAELADFNALREYVRKIESRLVVLETR